MSVITVSKKYEDVLEILQRKGTLPIVIVGCDKCAKTSKTGGTDEVREMRGLLRSSELKLHEVAGLVDAVEEGLCDPKAVQERMMPLKKSASEYQILVLACGAGLKCMRDALPGVRIVPGLDTLGPGVKGELACLACGDCRFGEDGCKMQRVAQAQSSLLTDGYACH